MIEISHFYKVYGSQKKDNFCVSDISLKAEPGKIVGLLGPNGSGKSTIMKAVCAFHYPTKGTIKVSGIDVTKEPEKAMNLIGYVPEISVLPNEMIVYDFLKYVCDVHSIEEYENAIHKVTKDCNLEKILSKKIKTLSKGQKQRVSFAQCLIYNPENLILDEPVSGLDPAQILQMRNLIKDLSKNKSIILSTHILQEINSLCDQIFILNNGKIVAQGTENEIVSQTNTKSLEQAFMMLTKENVHEE